MKRFCKGGMIKMKKEFKTPVIEICAISSADVIMVSAGTLQSGGTSDTDNMFSVSVSQSDSYNDDFKKWQDWI